MTSIPMRRQGHTLVAADPLSQEALTNAITDGAEGLVTISFPRNLRQLRLAWALAQKLSEMVDWLPDREAAMNYLKIKGRHIDNVIDGDGEVHVIPRSIAFASCSQAKFNRIFDRFIHVIVTDIVPGLDSQKLREEVLALVE